MVGSGNKYEALVVKSDNCCNQYKSAQSLNHLQSLSDKYNVPIIRIFGIPGHGKGEVDNVGGTVKAAVRQEVARGKYFYEAADCVSFLKNKFEDADGVKYSVKEIGEEVLNENQAVHRSYIYNTINGSSEFRIAIFNPNMEVFRAAPYLCLCSSCQVELGSCNLFKEYHPETQQLKTTTLRSYLEQTSIRKQGNDKEDDYADTRDFVVEGTICAIAASETSQDTVWFIFIINGETEATKLLEDTSGHQVFPGQKIIASHYLEHKSTNARHGEVYEVDKNKVVYIYKESIVYPFVNFQVEHRGKKELYSLKNKDYCDILHFIENNGMAHIYNYVVNLFLFS